MWGSHAIGGLGGTTDPRLQGPNAREEVGSGLRQARPWHQNAAGRVFHSSRHLLGPRLKGQQLPGVASSHGHADTPGDKPTHEDIVQASV